MLVDMRKKRGKKCLLLLPVFDVCKISGRKICVLSSLLETFSDPDFLLSFMSVKATKLVN